MDRGMPPPPQSPRETAAMPPAAPPASPGDPAMEVEQPRSAAAVVAAAAAAAATPPPAPEAGADKGEFSFSYELRDWLATDEPKVLSPWQCFGGYGWRLLIFPRGNGPEPDFSVYLECGGPKEQPVVPAAADPLEAAAATAAGVAEGAMEADGGAEDGEGGQGEVTETALDVSPLRVGKGKEPAPPPHVPAMWRRSTRFWLSLKPSDRSPPGAMAITKETGHTFLERESDWGFKEFCHISDIQKGRFEDSRGSLHIGVRLRLEDAAPDSMFNHGTWDSRKNTGYVGFKNQGATCYMNSLLQTLYMLGSFRRAVYSMPLPDPEDENVGGSRMSYALQKVFYELQYSDSTVKTKKLTESFGWDNTEAFTQHDVQELNRILCDHLEERMKKISPDQPNRISELFEGKILNYIECTNVEYKSTREESFYDLSLNVKGCRNLEESFDKYCEVETMDGDNKYRADGFTELQEARKGVRFLKLPPVLQLHLKRFEYDFNREAMVKINDRFEYPTEIDLSRYVDGPELGTEVYVLHSVLVHIGDVNGGHYYAYIRPSADSIIKSSLDQTMHDIEDGVTPAPAPTPSPLPSAWYKFDDDMVTAVSEDSAVVENFGSGGERGMDDPLSTLGSNNGDLNGMQTPPPSVYHQTRVRNYAVRRLSNAYMLQYIRRDQAEELLLPAQSGDVPADLAERIVSEQEDEERAKKARAEQHLYMNVSVATAKDMAEHDGLDAIAWDRVRSIRVKRTMRLRELKLMLQDQRLVGRWREMRLWRCAMRENETNRPESLLADGIDDNPIAEPGRDLTSLNNSYTMSYPRYSLSASNDDCLKIYVEDLNSEFCFGRGLAYRKALEQHQAIMAKEGDEEELVAEAAKVIPVNGFRLVKNEVLLFFKRYVPCPVAHLEFGGHFVVDRHCRVRDIISHLRRSISVRNNFTGGTTVSLAPDAPLLIYEEYASNKIKPLDWDRTFHEQEIPSGKQCAGDILIFMEASREAMEPVGSLLDDLRCFDRGRRPGLPLPDRYNPELPLGGRPLPTPFDFFRYLNLGIKVEFKNKYGVDTGDVGGIVLELMSLDSYKVVRHVLASAIGGAADAEHLRFYLHDIHRDEPASEPVRCMDDEEVRRMLPNQSLLASVGEYRTLWYERTEYALSEYDDKEEVRVTWRPDGGTRATPTDLMTAQTAKVSPKSADPPEATATRPTTATTLAAAAAEAEDMSDALSRGTASDTASAPPSPANGGGASVFSVLVPRGSKYHDVMDAIRTKLRLDEAARIRLCEVRNFRIQRFILPSYLISRSSTLGFGSLEHGSELRAEPVSEAEAAEGVDDVMSSDLVPVSVVHVAKDGKQRARKGITYFGVPIVLMVHVDGETVGDLRKRIRARLDVPEDVFATWKLVHVSSAPKLGYLEDMEQTWVPDGCAQNGMEITGLAMEHHGAAPPKKQSAAMLRFADAHKPLKIAG
jgi:ubiquitin C-terminal hydrolase